MKKVIISLISLVIVLVLVFLAVIPLWDSVKIKYIELNSKQQDLENLQRLTEKISRLKQEYQKLESESEKVFLALPKEKDIPNLLVQFQALAATNGLSMESIDFGQIATPVANKVGENVAIVDEEGGVADMTRTAVPTTAVTAGSQSVASSLRNLDVSMALTGTYEDFKKYLAALAKNIRSMDVKTIVFNQISQESAETRTETEDYKFNLSVIVYYQ